MKRRQRNVAHHHIVRRVGVLLAMSTSVVLVATECVASEAAEGGDHGGGGGSLLSADPGAAIWNLLIFIALLTVLMKFVWPQILQGLKAREEKIRGDLESAEKASAEAKHLLADYHQKIASAQAEAQSLLAQARKDAEAAGQRIVEQARGEAERQRDRAVSDITAAKQAALSEMADQTTKVAVQIARQMIGRELRAEDHADVVRNALQGMPSKN